MNDNWSFSAKVPPSLQIEDMNYTPVDGAQAAAANGADGQTPRKLYEDGVVPGSLSGAGLAEGDWVPVFDGMWHFGVSTVGDDGGYYFTNTNWVEVYSDAVSDTGSTPTGTQTGTVGKTTASGVLPSTGWPALPVALGGCALLAAGFVVGRKAGS